MATEGMIALQCGAFHVTTGGKKYFNTTPLGRAVTATAHHPRHARRRRQRLRRRQHAQGQRHPALFPLRHARQPRAHASTNRGSIPPSSSSSAAAKQMSDYLAGLGKPYKMSAEKAYSTDANVLGATHEAKDLERLDRGMHIVEPIMGRPFWKEGERIDRETVVVEFAAGVPRNDRRQDVPQAHRRLSRGQRHRRAPRARHERPDRKPRHRSQEPRDLRGAGHGAPAPRLRAAPLRGAQREHARSLFHAGAAASAACSTRASGSIRRRWC